MTIKYTHLRDATNPDRVLTIAREFDPTTQTVKFGWSINRPPERVLAYIETFRDEKVSVNPEHSKHYKDGVRTRRVRHLEPVERKIKGDVFCKKTGRTNAERRLRESPSVISGLLPNETPLFAILFNLVIDPNVPASVSEVAHWHARLTPEFRTDMKNSPVRKSFLDRLMGFLRGA